jgi:hypothetical protein
MIAGSGPGFPFARPDGPDDSPALQTVGQGKAAGLRMADGFAVSEEAAK